MPSHTIVSREEWREARTAHLAKEKEFTRLRDQLSAERRALPWVKVDKTYVFEGPAVHVGVVARDRLQLRLSRVVHEGPDREGRRGLQLRPARIPERGSPRHQRLL